MRKVADERSFSLLQYQHLLAAIANGQLSRKDGRLWMAADFVTEDRQSNVRPIGPSKEELKSRLISSFGPDGKKPKGKSKSKPDKSALATLVGQSLPKRA